MPAPTPRTTSDLVRGIIQTQDNVDLSPFIAIANQLTTDNCTYPKPGQDPALFLPYTDGFVGSKMELIERWLSAHAYCCFDNQLSNAKAGTVAVGFQYKIDLNLKNTMYGQMALMTDTYGGLAELANTLNTKRFIKVTLKWLGTPIGPCGWLISDDTTIVE